LTRDGHAPACLSSWEWDGTVLILLLLHCLVPTTRTAQIDFGFYPAWKTEWLQKSSQQWNAGFCKISPNLLRVGHNFHGDLSKEITLPAGRHPSHEQILSAVSWFFCRCLKLNPKDRRRNDAKEHVSLKLKLMRTSAKPDTVIEACFKFWIYDQSFGKHSEHLGK